MTQEGSLSWKLGKGEGSGQLGSGEKEKHPNGMTLHFSRVDYPVHSKQINREHSPNEPRAYEHPKLLPCVIHTTD